MKLKKLNAEDLISSIKYVSQIFSTSDNIETFMKSSIHIMLYNEMNKYSKEELESVKDSKGGKDEIYEKVMYSRNPLLFSVLIQKGAFSEKLNAQSKWLLKNIEPSPTLYEAVFNCQSERQSKSFENFMYFLSKNLDALDESKQIKIADIFYKDFGKKNEEDILTYIFKNASTNEAFTDRILNCYKQDKIDINKYGLLNNFINKPWDRSKYSNLFISSTDLPKIEDLLKKGFRFEQEKFDYYGESLFVAVLKSAQTESQRTGRVDIVKALLPSLEMTQPRGMTMDQQHALLDIYQESSSYTEIKQLYYEKYAKYLESKLSISDSPNLAKMKI